MASIVICSAVRDAMAYIAHYRSQLDALKLPDGYSWHLCIIEGDSTDGTHEYLINWASQDPRISLGKLDVGSTSDIEERAVRWAGIGNRCIDLIPKGLDYTHLVWLEADLCFPPELLSRLIRNDVDVVAPLIWLGPHFYDTWGFRDLQGNRWTNSPPYHRDFRPMSLMEMGSVGSCVLFRRSVLESGIRFRGPYETGLLVGMCNDARARGFKVFADTSTALLHPMDLWEAQMWKPAVIYIEDLNGQVRALSLSEAQRLGIHMNLPAFDANFLSRAQFGFLKNVASLNGTNRISVQASSTAKPPKKYSIKIKLLEPRIFGLASPLIAHGLRLGGPFRILRKTFNCDVQTTIEEEASSQL